MALIQGMENANKTGVRFGWCANGGFLEGVKWVPAIEPALIAEAGPLTLLGQAPRPRLGAIVPLARGRQKRRS